MNFKDSISKFISTDTLTDLLSDVKMPSQYIGCEPGSIVKKDDPNLIKVLLAFPDTYEIGMSYLGFRILYYILNSKPYIAAERVFTPWVDMEAKMKNNGVPLFSLESRRHASSFDIIGFSLQYELSITNLLTMLYLSGISLRSRDRCDGDPLIIAGGPVALNPEPYSAFIDAFFIGDGEDGFLEIVEEYKKIKDHAGSRKELLQRLAQMESVYVPQMTKIDVDPKTGMLYRTGADGSDINIKRRIVPDLSPYPFASKIIVPYGKTVQDKFSIEIGRGCGRGCRFCQAGYIYRPERERPVQQVIDSILEGLSCSGYDEVSLSGLTPTDYREIEGLVTRLGSELLNRNASLSISSVRMDELPIEVVEVISKLRKTGFTLAPEAGSQRMRNVINKNLTEEQILESARIIFNSGWRLIKLYFMIGLPSEQEEDLTAIAELAQKVYLQGNKRTRKREINLAVSSFVPKPHTPFQWESMENIDRLKEKQYLIKRRLTSHNINFKYHDPRISFLEGLISRGDSRLSDVIEQAWRLGARFDGWSDFNNLDKWLDALRKCEINPDSYVANGFPLDSRLPWDHIDSGVSKEHLINERDKAFDGLTSPPCPERFCTRCGVCKDVDRKYPEIKEYEYDVPFGECGISQSDQKKDTGNGNRVSNIGAVNRGNEPKFVYTAYYSKMGIFRYLSHLDILRTFSRVLRRAGVPLKYTRGFHPKPILIFPPPLQVGVAGAREMLDFTTIRMLTDSEISEYIGRINQFFPHELQFLSIEPSISGKSPSLRVLAAVFSAGLNQALEIQGARTYYTEWERLWKSSDPIIINIGTEQEPEEKDIRLLLEDIKLREKDRRIVFTIRYRADGSVKPKSFLKEFFSEIVNFNDIQREGFIIS